MLWGGDIISRNPYVTFRGHVLIESQLQQNINREFSLREVHLAISTLASHSHLCTVTYCAAGMDITWRLSWFPNQLHFLAARLWPW